MIPDVKQMLKRMNQHIIVTVIEPSGPDRNIHFGGPVISAAGRAVLQQRHPVLFDGRPVRRSGESAFVAAPAQIAMLTHVTEYHRLRRTLPDHRIRAFKIVFLHFAVRPLSARAVKPGDENIPAARAAVIREQLAELIGIEFVIGVTGTVGLLMTVPRRKIKSDFQPVLLRRPDEIADHVSFAVAPFGIAHRMGRVFAGPQTEPVVMFRGKNRPFETRLRNDPAPLSAIKFRWIETIFRFRAVSPLAPGKRIDREMKERIHAHFLPGKLLTVRRRPEWSRCSVVHERSPFFLFINLLFQQLKVLHIERKNCE